jgi:hypothetical protein
MRFWCCRLARWPRPPVPRTIQAPIGQATAKPYLGGLHHLYTRAAQQSLLPCPLRSARTVRAQMAISGISACSRDGKSHTARPISPRAYCRHLTGPAGLADGCGFREGQPWRGWTEPNTRCAGETRLAVVPSGLQIICRKGLVVAGTSRVSWWHAREGMSGLLSQRSVLHLRRNCLCRSCLACGFW